MARDATKDKHPVTEQHFSYYQGQVHRWLDFWAIKDWRPYFEFKNLKEALAAYSIDHAGKTFTIALSKMWNVPITKKLLSKCAFHEVVEIMLECISRWMSCSRYDMDEGIHSVVRRLENIIFEKEWNRNE